MNCDAIRDLLGAYVLGILDQDTEAAVHGHLATCPDCQEIAANYETIVGELPQLLVDASEITLPARAKGRLMEAVSVPAQRQTASIPARFLNALPMGSRSNVRRYAVPVLSFLLVISLLWSVYLGTALARERDYRMTLEHQTELIFEVVDSDNTERAFLRPVIQVEEDRLPPYGKVFTRSDMPFVVAMTGRLPEPPAGQAYHLWLYRDGEAQRVGQLAVDEMGFSSLVYQAEQSGLDYERAEVILQDVNSQTPASGTLILNWEEQ